MKIYAEFGTWDKDTITEHKVLDEQVEIEVTPESWKEYQDAQKTIAKFEYAVHDEFLMLRTLKSLKELEKEVQRLQEVDPPSFIVRGEMRRYR
jgi:hypothetical protein